MGEIEKYKDIDGLQKFNNFVIFKTEDGKVNIDVYFKDETLWLTQKAIAILFEKGRSTITEHLSKIFEDGELSEKVVCRAFRLTTKHGAIEDKKLSEHREIEVTKEYMFIDADGQPISTKEFINKIFGYLPQCFNTKEELVRIWANPQSREELLKKLEIAGFGVNKLISLQEIIDAKDSDLLDVLEFIAYAIKPISREERVNRFNFNTYNKMNDNEISFIEFMIDLYIKNGVSQLNNDNFSNLITMKYGSIADAQKYLGENKNIRDVFLEFQELLYCIR